MRKNKESRMMEAYQERNVDNGIAHNGPYTVRRVMEVIPQELLDQLTGRQLGLVMQAVNCSYHRGVKEASESLI